MQLLAGCSPIRFRVAPTAGFRLKCSASSRVRVDLADLFLARERLSRLEGLVQFFVRILKVFLYGMRKLETNYSILSITAFGHPSDWRYL